jgi:hypothetical protein
VQKILTFKPITWVLARGFLLQFIEEIRIDSFKEKRKRKSGLAKNLSTQKTLEVLSLPDGVYRTWYIRRSIMLLHI